LVRNGAHAEQQKADPPPYVPGMEAVGIVDEVGSDVPNRLKLGDAVMAIVVPKGSHGAYREQIVLDARSIVRAPAGKTHAEVATLPMNGLTARLSLDLLKLSPGQVIAVTGAAGAYGGYVICGALGFEKDDCRRGAQLVRDGYAGDTPSNDKEVGLVGRHE
jgi:NADPH:quinone reductase-like Zn-dependent oxidoreductase